MRCPKKLFTYAIVCNTHPITCPKNPLLISIYYVQRIKIIGVYLANVTRKQRRAIQEVIRAAIKGKE